MVTGTKFNWLLNFGVAATFVLSVGAPGAAWAKAKPKPVTQGSRPAGPAGAGADPILIIKGAVHGAHASISHDTCWCGLGDCDASIASAFELGTPVGPRTVSQLHVSLGEKPPPLWNEDEYYHEGDLVSFGGGIQIALDGNEDCMPGQAGGGCGGDG